MSYKEEKLQQIVERVFTCTTHLRLTALALKFLPEHEVLINNDIYREVGDLKMFAVRFSIHLGKSMFTNYRLSLVKDNDDNLELLITCDDQFTEQGSIVIAQGSINIKYNSMLTMENIELLGCHIVGDIKELFFSIAKDTTLSSLYGLALKREQVRALTLG